MKPFKNEFLKYRVALTLLIVAAVALAVQNRRLTFALNDGRVKAESLWQENQRLNQAIQQLEQKTRELIVCRQKDTFEMENTEQCLDVALAMLEKNRERWPYYREHREECEARRHRYIKEGILITYPPFDTSVTPTGHERR